MRSKILGLSVVLMLFQSNVDSMSQLKEQERVDEIKSVQKMHMKVRNKKEDISTGEETHIASGLIVVKEDGIYLRRSIADYYIDFSESRVDRERFKNYILQFEETRPITLEVEFRKGCPFVRDNKAPPLNKLCIVIHRIIEDHDTAS